MISAISYDFLWRPFQQQQQHCVLVRISHCISHLETVVALSENSNIPADFCNFKGPLCNI